MALRPIQPGLRAMVNPSHDVAKVALVVPAANVLYVSDEVAGQLERQGFRDVLAPAVVEPVEQVAEVQDVPKGKKAKG